MSGQRGFTAIELLLSIALMSLLGIASLLAVRALMHGLQRNLSATAQSAVLDAETRTLRSEATSAFAIFVPQAGASHELDFYAKTAAGRDIFWRYAYDGVAHTLQRSDYDPDGTAGVRDTATGSIDPRATYPPLRGVRNFTAQVIRADRLGAVGALYAGALAPLLGDAVPRALPVSLNRAGLDVSGLYGGNAVVQVVVQSASARRLVHLLPGSLPTGFSVHAVPVFHAVVYRFDTTHRFWLGLAQQSHMYVNGRVDVSYDGWRTQKTWCDFNIFGNPDGLIGGPMEDYHPEQYVESAAGLMDRCIADTKAGIFSMPQPGAAAPAVHTRR